MREPATNVEWVAYYRRADALRRRLGDPFERLVRRRDRRGRIFRIGLTVVAVAAAAGMVVGVLWLFNNVDWTSLMDGGGARLVD